jgi:predicted Co/Zn/Cd cation transporter (cation efflux family)
MKIAVSRDSIYFVKEAIITTDSMIDLVLMKYALREYLLKTPNAVKYRVEAMIHELDETTRVSESQ